MEFNFIEDGDEQDDQTDLEASDLGDVAENEIRLFLSKQNITVTTVTRDKKGWDFLLEFSPGTSSISTLSPDERPSEFTCKLQVKAIDELYNRVKINLSNWHRMVKDPLPYFCVILIYNKTKELKKLRIIHIGKEWIEKILRQLRELERKDWNRLHKKIKWLSCTETTLLESSFDHSLANYIRETVGNDFPSYLRQKTEWVEKVGYESNGNFKVSFTFPSIEFEAWARHAVGLEKQVAISKFTVEQIRFGIPRPLHLQENTEEGILKVEVPSFGQTIFTLESQDGTRRASINFETYMAARVFPFLPPQYYYQRYVSPFLNIFLDPQHSGPDLNFSIPEDQKFNLFELADVSKFMSLLASDKSLVLILEKEGKKTKRKIPPVSIPAGTKALCELIKETWFLHLHFDGDREVKVSISSLMNQQQQIHTMAQLLRPSFPRLPGAFATFRGAVEYQGKEVAIPICLPVVLQDQALVLCGAIIGTASTNDSPAAVQSFTLQDPKFYTIKTHLIHKHDSDNLSLIPLIRGIEMTLSKDGFYVVSPLGPQL